MKEGFIEVHDNILPPAIEDSICSVSLNNVSYNYKSDLVYGGGEHFFPGFVRNLYDPNQQYTDFKYFPLYSQVLSYFCIKRQINIISIERYRMFLSLPFQGKDQSVGIHTDLEDSNGETIPHWTCLYYVNDSDGDTIFFDNDKNEIKRVSPKKGRVIFFDGKIPHSGNYLTQNERIGVNINFIGELWK